MRKWKFLQEGQEDPGRIVADQDIVLAEEHHHKASAGLGIVLEEAVHIAAVLHIDLGAAVHIVVAHHIVLAEVDRIDPEEVVHIALVAARHIVQEGLLHSPSNSSHPSYHNLNPLNPAIISTTTSLASNQLADSLYSSHPARPQNCSLNPPIPQFPAHCPIYSKTLSLSNHFLLAQTGMKQRLFHIEFERENQKRI